MHALAVNALGLQVEKRATLGLDIRVTARRRSSCSASAGFANSCHNDNISEPSITYITQCDKYHITEMDFSLLLFFFVIIIPSAIIHEYAHGAVAGLLGDDTAERAGRLTLNPIAHIDPFGTLLLPLILLLSNAGFMFAYAKPVPYNPYNLRDQKWGPALVGAAGPLSNIAVALVFGLLVRFLPLSPFTVFLALVTYANILLAVFNMIPIPPLDGSKVLFALIPDRYWQFKEQFERYGILFLFAFIFLGFSLIIPIIQGLFSLIVGSSLGSVLIGS